MCGIAAIIYPHSNGEKEMSNMLKKIEHRGDSEPVQVGLGNSLLGSVRLKIVDRENAIQPIFNDSKTIGIVFNGEIYNYKTLKISLENKGYKFKTDSDTEVILRLYEEYNYSFLLQLEGMFSFIIYDKTNNSFFGARDFFGVKPFYYCKNKESYYVSSEMKSFLELDVETFEELKPGHFITNNGITSYYQIPITKWNKDSFGNIKKKVRQLVETAVKKRVQTDLPIATFLSGGLDSTIVHLLCCKYHPDVTALIVGDDLGEDVIYAKRFCKDYNLKYKHIKSSNVNMVKSIAEVVYVIETFEPNPIRGSLLSMKLGELAKNEGFKVILCGEGCDEVFAGYGDFIGLTDENEFQNKILDLLADLYRTQLLRLDKTSMRYSVEVREPFLDRELVEFALNIHPNMKVSKNDKGRLTTKSILREAFKDMLPDYIYYREKMTLMEGAGIGGVEKGKGLLNNYANSILSEQEFNALIKNNPEYNLKDKEDALCFSIYNHLYSKAYFSKNRVINAQKEIIDAYEH